MIEIYEKAAKATFENAIDLLDEADLLYEKEKYARAHALAVLAAEELAKSAVYRFRSAGLVSEAELKEFETVLLDHTLKLTAFTSYGMALIMLREDPRELLRAWEEAQFRIMDLQKFVKPIKGSIAELVMRIFGSGNPTKKRAFYVEVKEVKLFTPKTSIEPELARQSIEIVHMTVPYFKHALEMTDKEYATFAPK